MQCLHKAARSGKDVRLLLPLEMNWQGSLMKSSPFVSIVIPFIEWNSYVDQCVKKCLELNYKNFEIVLVPDTRQNTPLKSRRIRVVYSGKSNISEKRNIGIRNSSKKTKYFAFVDSDAYPRKDWLKNTTKHFNDGYSAIGGPNITPPDDNLRQKCTGNIIKSFFCGGPRSFQVNEKSGSRICGDLPTCNLVVEKNALKAADYFDESLETGEDLKMCYNIVKNNGKIFFADDVVVYHHRRPLFTPFLRQRFIYGRSVPAIIRKERSRSNVYLLAPAAFLIFLVAGAVLSAYFRFLSGAYFLVIAAFLVAGFSESVRFSKSLREVPFTYIGFVAGIIAPAVGTLVSVFRPSYSLRGKYTNYGKKQS